MQYERDPLTLTFIDPCIANVRTQSTTNKMQLFTNYFCKTLYMFQTGFPSIIRSSKLHIQRQVFVRPLLLPAGSLVGMNNPDQATSRYSTSIICINTWPI